ncbi:hypothetical protein HOP50_03g23370 [Chloropicon primus]|uniref:CS domain-containing protein n=2 Tax=Chloropicon primus TaxID=1764295 RepID=A0A5B8MHR5_9CHLO|nr:hypothetical protein A3770_03p23390 [Chloropicon primus]UPQ99031.1 hypothetical protein HOP50_03g23370 [Chloropicon primus]|eukprot:QDZ19821.1 hypothetical protein A3770_03p23390 [Chloropicon primus]
MATTVVKAGGGRPEHEAAGFANQREGPVATEQRVARARRANDKGNDKFKIMDFEGALGEYTRGLDVLASAGAKRGDPASELRQRLLCNRASAYLRRDEAGEALRDCEAAIDIDGENPKPYYRGGLARLALADYRGARAMLTRSSSLGSNECDLGVLLETCEHLVGNEELASRLEGTERGTEVAGILARYCEQLIDDGDDEDCDIGDVLDDLLKLLRREPSAKVLFDRACHWRALLFYLTDSYGHRVSDILKELVSGPHAVAWPPIVTGRLVSTVLEASYEEGEKETAMNLILYSASIPMMTSWFLIRPSREVAGVVGKDGAVVPAHLVFSSLRSKARWETIPVKFAQYYVWTLSSFCKAAHGSEMLAKSHIRPISDLVFMFEHANDLKGAFDELADASIPSHFDRVTTAEEAEKFFRREKKRMYNVPVIDLKHSVLDELNVLVRDGSGLRNEAFVRETTALGKSTLKPTRLLVDLLALAKEMHKLSPLKSAPVLGQDGAAKTYEKRPFAADFSKNPFGDAFIEEEHPSRETMLSKLMDVLIGCCDVKNAAITLCSKNIHSLLVELSKYATESIVEKAVELYKVLSSSCQAFASEVLNGDTDMIAYTGLLLTKRPDLQCAAMNKIVLMLSTCSGDDFSWFTKKGSGLDACYTLLCRCMADSGGTYQEFLTAGGKSKSSPSRDVIELCKIVFLQSLERCRLRKKSKFAIPKGGAWDTFGNQEIMEMERFLTGKPVVPPTAAEIPSEASVRIQNASEPQRTVASPTPLHEEGKLRKGFFGSKKSYRRSSKGKDRAQRIAADTKPSVVKKSEVSKEEEVIEEIANNPLLSDEKQQWEEDNRGPEKEDGTELKVVWDSTPSDEIKKHRTDWANMDHSQKLSWTQSSTEVTATVKVPKGTKAKDLEIVVTPTRLLVKLRWYGRVFDGPLSRRCKASESWWILDGDQIEICIPKDDNHFWRSLFEGGQMKSYYEVLQELVHADEPAQSYEDLPEESKDLVDELRERQELVSEGLIDPDIFDDFRCVLSDGDGAK